MSDTKSAVIYTLDKCVKCTKCVRVCPTSALTLSDNRISIADDKCINCGQCIRVCHNQGLVAKGSPLQEIENYDFTIAMIPSAMLSRCSSKKDVGRLLKAIEKLGFDVVEDISVFEGIALTELSRQNNENESSVISSICPVVRQLILLKYPMLKEQISKINDPSEIAAKYIRRKYHDHGKVGIFYFAECEAKLLLAKYPYGHMQYETDHALVPTDILPMINEHLSDEGYEHGVDYAGLLSVNPMMMSENSECLIADGYEKVDQVLNMSEFGLLNTFKEMHLYSCFNGCIGGHLLWGNSFLLKHNINALSKTQEKPILLDDELIRPSQTAVDGDQRSLAEKLAYFAKVNDQLEKLPGYDCSACGLQTCRIMAEEIVNGRKTLMDCHILQAKKEK